MFSEESLNTVQELEKRVERAEAERKAAEEELEGYKAQVAPTKAKIEAFGKKFVSLQESYQAMQQRLRQTEAKCTAEHRARIALEPRVKTAETRVIELEVRFQHRAAFTGLRINSYRQNVHAEMRPTTISDGNE